ncbi:MAG: transporter transrane region family protein [Micavibrio sp.]|nr:transporter transrane region family protein [Micavibrio sp.]
MKKTLIPEGYGINAVQLIVPSVFIAVLSLTLPVLTLQVYDRILPNPDSGTLPILVAGVCVAVLLEMALRLCRAYTLGWSGAAYEHRLSCEAVNHILRTNLSTINRDGAGENLNRIAAISKLREFHNGYDLITYTELAFIVPYLVLIAYIAGPLVLVPVVILALFALVSVVMGKWLNRALAARDRADDTRYDFLIDGLQGVHTIKAFSLEKPFLRRYERLQYNATVANYEVTEATSGVFNAAAVFSHLMLASVITIGAWRVLDGGMTSGALIATIFLSGRVMQPVQRALALWTRYQDYQVAAEKVRKIFAMPLAPQGQKITTPEPQRAGTLTLQNIAFGDMFQNINLSLMAGDCIQISGAYGSGKSTLLKIMAGLYIPDHGSVMIDGREPMDIPPQAMMNHVGLISTEGAIFRGRIRDNLTRFGSIPEDAVRPISAMLGIEQDVSVLPRGFDTWMEGVEQDTVPPGLRQRIAMARILATHPKIILFDNAERNLDREGYRQIHTLLGRLRSKVALVLVAEDNNIASLASRHFRLTRRGLIEQPILNDTILSFRETRT